MTPHAGDVAVLTGQRKAGFSMIIGQSILPPGDRMASLTIAAKATQMRIFFGMATGASRRSRPITAARFVTADALGFGMPANQRIIGQTVVERCRVKGDNPVSSTMMFAMTGFALLRSGGGFAVKTCTLVYVTCDAFVARQAHAVHGFFLESLVTAVTLLLQLGMGRAEGTRAYNFFPSGLRVGIGRQQDRTQQRQNGAPKPHQYICTATIWRTTVATKTKNKGKCRTCHNRSNRS